MDNTKNKVGIISLVVIILLFVIGGFFFMNYMVDKSKNETKKDNVTEVTEHRIDTKKDYVYYENSEELIDEVFIEDVILNFEGLENINNSLHEELINLSKDKKTTEGIELPEGTTCENDLYSFSYRDYTYTKFSKYISLLIIDYKYNCETGSIPVSMKSYVIEKNTGKLLSNDDLLKDFNASNDDVLNAVKKKLNDTQTLLEDKEVIDVEGTINDFNNGSFGTNKALNVSKNGKLAINFIVKSKEINYNDSIELN